MGIVLIGAAQRQFTATQRCHHVCCVLYLDQEPHSQAAPVVFDEGPHHLMYDSFGLACGVEAACRLCISQDHHRPCSDFGYCLRKVATIGVECGHAEGISQFTRDLFGVHSCAIQEKRIRLPPGDLPKDTGLADPLLAAEPQPGAAVTWPVDPPHCTGQGEIG
ncbi:hypothetical protein ACFYO2_21425 [Streptomyces sp. NPDC006602]|uniref:hypothetical protein n=1 Tax=Streptomyces sp. NPDC006602 TaxID=3364751 RepID=UPI0036AB7A56